MRIYIIYQHKNDFGEKCSILIIILYPIIHSRVYCMQYQQTLNTICISSIIYPTRQSVTPCSLWFDTRNKYIVPFSPFLSFSLFCNIFLHQKLSCKKKIKHAIFSSTPSLRRKTGPCSQCFLSCVQICAQYCNVLLWIKKSKIVLAVYLIAHYL